MTETTLSLFEITIPPELDKHRLDKALTELLAGQVSRGRMQALMEEGHVTLSGKPVSDASKKAKLGDIYQVILPPPEAAAPEAWDTDLAIVYEDKDLLVIDKPAGMVVHPAPGNREKTLVNALLAHCGESLSGIGGVARPGIVHRLDKETSGLIVVAKNDLAHRALTSQFADRSLSRTYQALVWGIPVPLAGSVDAAVGRHPRDRKKMAVVTSKGKAALTHYTVLKEFDPYVSLIECKLATGRTHQIRVHMAHIHYPVVGDPVYGAKKPPIKGLSPALAKQLTSFPRQALHAVQLKFIHPRTKKIMSFQSPLPKDMKGLLSKLGKL